MAHHVFKAQLVSDNLFYSSRVDLDVVGAFAAQLLAEHQPSLALYGSGFSERPQCAAELDEVALLLLSRAQIRLRLLAPRSP